MSTLQNLQLQLRRTEEQSAMTTERISPAMEPVRSCTGTVCGWTPDDEAIFTSMIGVPREGLLRRLLQRIGVVNQDGIAQERE